MRGLASVSVRQATLEGLNPQKATEKVSEALRKQFGADTGGLIAVNAMGELGFAMNTKGMGRAYWRVGAGEGPVQAIWSDEVFQAL